MNIVTNAIDWVISLLMERMIKMVPNPMIPYITAASNQYGLLVSVTSFRGFAWSYLERRRAKSWKKINTTRNHPKKFEIGTPKYAPQGLPYPLRKECRRSGVSAEIPHHPEKRGLMKPLCVVRVGDERYGNNRYCRRCPRGILYSTLYSRDTCPAQWSCLLNLLMS